MCVKIQGERPATHIVLPHGMGNGNCSGSEESKVRVYACALETVSGNMPLHILVHPAWIVTYEDQVNFNKVSEVYQDLRDKEPGVARVAIPPSTAIEKMRSTMEIYIHRCLIPALLVGT